jgi:hypothetical protein
VPAGVAAVLLGGTTPAMAGGVLDPGPVAPDQFFVGLVNGQAAQARIAVACDGPVPTGHPVAGQTVEVRQLLPPVPQTTGYTGSAASEIGVVFGPTSTSAAPPVRLRFYLTRAQIPTDLVVPCGGKGTVTFGPLPTSPTARPATVDVTYVGPA